MSLRSYYFFQPSKQLIQVILIVRREIATDKEENGMLSWESIVIIQDGEFWSRILVSKLRYSHYKNLTATLSHRLFNSGFLASSLWGEWDCDLQSSGNNVAHKNSVWLDIIN